MALFAIVSPRLMMTRRYKRSSKVDHHGDAEMVDSERRANAVAALSLEARAAQEAYRRESRRFALLSFGPLLVGFIPLILVGGAYWTSAGTELA